MILFQNQMTGLEVRHLRAFAAVADERHFGRAATRLGIAQPLLSSLVARAEAIVGARLLERRPAVRLTPAGELFLTHALHALQELDWGMEGVRRLARGVTGRLHLGFPGWVVATPLPGAVALYRRSHPDVELTLLDLNTSGQLEALKSRRLHLGFLIAPPADDPELVVEPLYAEPWLAVTPATHPLAAQQEVEPEQIQAEAFISFPRRLAPEVHDQIGSIVDRNRLRVVQEAEAWVSVLAMVRTGIGVSIVPASVRRLWSEGVCYLPLKGVDAQVTVGVCRPRGEMSPSARAFMEILRAEVTRRKPR
jgi:DNA-binding transcriptional LysR family regulator